MLQPYAIGYQQYAKYLVVMIALVVAFRNQHPQLPETLNESASVIRSADSSPSRL